LLLLAWRAAFPGGDIPCCPLGHLGIRQEQDNDPEGDHHSVHIDEPAFVDERMAVDVKGVATTGLLPPSLSHRRWEALLRSPPWPQKRVNEEFAYSHGHVASSRAIAVTLCVAVLSSSDDRLAQRR
jgi:hypothetical protein